MWTTSLPRSVCDQFGHCLLGDLGAFREHAHGGAGVVEVLEDRAVHRPHGGVAVLGEALQDKVVDRDVDLAHQHGQVGRALPATHHGKTC